MFDRVVGQLLLRGILILAAVAFVRHESSYRSGARPPVEWLWFIPQPLKSGTGVSRPLPGTPALSIATFPRIAPPPYSPLQTPAIVPHPRTKAPVLRVHATRLCVSPAAPIGPGAL